MALKGDRWEFQTDISYFCNVAAERGVILVHSGGGSGAALDDTSAVVTLHTGAIGLKPAGLLLNDVVDIDLTQFGHMLNRFKDETLKNGKCTLLRKGWVVTDKIASGTTPVAGDKAYLGVNGLVTPSATGSPPLVGVFLGAKDQNGYAKVEINLPNAG